MLCNKLEAVLAVSFFAHFDHCVDVHCNCFYCVTLSYDMQLK